MDKEKVEEFLSDANYRRVKNRRIKLKEKLVEYKGGKCERCGYCKCLNALDFHHIDPNEKDFSISSSSVLSFKKLKTEVDKCILVCANCHREIHFEEEQKKRQKQEILEKQVYSEILRNRDVYGSVPIKESYKYLEDAGIFEDLKNKRKRKDILSKYHINNRTFNKFLESHNIVYSDKKIIKDKPNKDELIELLKTHSKSSIGRMFGVSCSAVIKWCKKYNINE